MSRFNPIELETIEVRLLLRNGDKAVSTIKLFDISSIPPFQDRCKVVFISKYLNTEASDFCYFSAFQQIRTKLDDIGITPLVNAALKNCYPSSMASDMGGGLKVYQLTMNTQSKMEDLIATFDECLSGNFATVEKQKGFYQDWCESVANAT